jgi:4-amino-4-deoxy-L-arabinose transferase-like glycosyltransferase
VNRAGRFAPRLAAILAGALVVRLVYTIAGPGDAYGDGFVGDMFFYHELANLLADGRGFVSPFEVEHFARTTPTAEHPPLWPLLLSAASELGGNGLLAHRLAGVPVGVATAGVLGLVGRRLAGDTAGLAVAAIAACHPLLIAADGSLMSETLYGLWVASALLLTLRLLEHPTAAAAAALGAVMGLAALTRGEGLLLLPLLAAPAVWRGSSERARTGAVLLAATALVLAPWAIRNLTTFDDPVLVSTNDATVLTGANCDRTYHGRDLGFWRTECRSPPVERDESEQAAIWREDGIDYARDHAGRLVAVVVPVRVMRTWGVWRPRQQVDQVEGRDRTMEALGTGVYFLLLPLAAYGAVLLRRRRASLWVLLVPPVAVTIVSVAGYGYTRFRHSADLAIVVLAGLALAHLAERRAAP